MSMNSFAQFEAFERSYSRWLGITQPVAKTGDLWAQSLYVELDHVVTHIRTIATRARSRSTDTDYERIADVNISEIAALGSAVKNAASLTNREKEEFTHYLEECGTVWQAIRILPVPVEGYLGFRRSVLSSFGFLENEFGFRMVASSPISVRYESQYLSIELLHSPQCPELSFSLSRLDDGADYVLDDIAYRATGQCRFQYEQFNLCSADGTEQFVKAAAQVIRKYAGDILQAGPDSLQSLRLAAEERERRCFSEE